MTITTIEEILSYKRLRKRFLDVADCILLKPNSTVIWIGAGISTKYGKLPTWSQFILNISKKEFSGCGELDIIDRLVKSGRSTIAAELLYEEIGEKYLQYITEVFETPKGSLPADFSYWNVRDIITTNYDMLLEDALPWYNSISPIDEMDKLISKNFKIVKLHGSVTDPNQCVASVSAYARSYNSGLYWYLSNLFSSCSVVFLGSSMSLSEPFFKVLKILHDNNRLPFPHYCLMSVKSNEEAAIEGKRLAGYGILLIPYKSNNQHTFIDEFLAYIESRRGKPKSVEVRLQISAKYIEEKQFTYAVYILWHLCHADIRNEGTKRKLGDKISDFFREATEYNNPNSLELYNWCKNNQFDLCELWSLAAGLIIPSVKALYGLENALKNLLLLSEHNLPHHRKKLKELWSIVLLRNLKKIEALSDPAYKKLSNVEDKHIFSRLNSFDFSVIDDLLLIYNENFFQEFILCEDKEVLKLQAEFNVIIKKMSLNLNDNI